MVGPGPPRKPRPVTARVAILAALGWTAFVAALWYATVRWHWLGAVYVLLALTVLSMIGLLVTAARAARGRAPGTLRATAPELLRGGRRIYAATRTWHRALVRFFLCANAIIVVLALSTTDWKLLAWTLLGFAGIVIAGMIEFFTPARRR